MTMLFDKTGATFTLDHEIDGTAYVRPMVKVVHLMEGYEGNTREHEDLEPAEYLIAIARSELFDSPPVEAVNQEISAKKSELEALKSEGEKAIREINAERSAIKSDLQHAKHQLDMWMKKHRLMMDLGKLLDGKVLYPLSVRENPHHHSRDIPYIPKKSNMDLLILDSGNFETGQPWRIKEYPRDTYGHPFRFFDTEEERAAVICSEFEEACQAFRKRPDFDTTSYSTGTTLHYGTLMKWVKTHPPLTIPDDIQAMKADHDAKLIEAKKAELAAELAQLSA